MSLTEALDTLFAAAVFDMDTPELKLPGQALQLRDQAGRIVLTYIGTRDPTLSKTATEDNAGVPLGDDSALHAVFHRVTWVDAGRRRRDDVRPLAPGERGIVADLGSTCNSWQPGDGYFPEKNSYGRGTYEEFPVVKDGVADGLAYYGLILPVVTDNAWDHPGLEYWFYTGGPGEPGQRGGHVPRMAIGKGLFSFGLSDPGHGNIAFDVAYLTAAEVSMVRFRTFKPEDLPNPRTIGPAMCFFDEGRGRGPEPIYSTGRRWNRLKVE
jgi:hypothetical protein